MKLLVLLGGGLNKGSKLSVASKMRCKKAIELQDKFDFILCSANKTYRHLKHINIFKRTEAELAKEYMIRKGVCPHKIFTERLSKDTLTNAFFCRRDFIDKFKIKEFSVVTSKFHMKKSKYVFNAVFDEKYKIHFIEVGNGRINKKILHSREISEDCLVEFYKTHLRQVYNVEFGDMLSLENFVFHHNPAMTGHFDKYHKALTKEIESKILVKNPLY